MITIKKRQDTYEYIPYSELEAEQPFTVAYRLPTHEEFARLSDARVSYTDTGETKIESNDFYLKLCTLCIVGWVNLTCEDEEVVFTGDLSPLPFSLIEEIGLEISEKATSLF